MIIFFLKKFITRVLVIFFLTPLIGTFPISPASAAISPAAVNLGSAESFAVLAATYATTGAPSRFNGNIGAGSAITTGASNTIVGSMYSSHATTVGAGSSINGNLYAGAAITLGAGSSVSGSQYRNPAPQFWEASDVYTSAMSSLNTAITDIYYRPATAISGTLGGVTLTPGVYLSVASLGLTGALTLDAQGDSDAVFIIKSDGFIATAASSVVVLRNQAQAKNVFWATEGYFTAGADSIFKGSVLASGYISVGANTAIQGRLFSQSSYVFFGIGSANSIFGIPGIGTSVITPPNTPNLAPTIASATITGTLTSGSTLTAIAGTVTGSPTPTLAYVWYRNGAVISGATGATLLLTTSDVGRAISLRIQATNAISPDAYAYSDPTALVSAASSGTGSNLAPTIASATITGTLTSGSTLTAIAGTVTGSPTPTLAYLWSRNGVVISGATGITLLLTSADIGREISLIIKASNGINPSAYAYSEPTVTISPLDLGTVPGAGSNRAPTISSANISGSAKTGSTFRAVAGIVTGSPTPTLSYVWSRNGVVISGATKVTYALVDADAGKEISIIIKASNGVNPAAYAYSDPTDPVEEDTPSDLSPKVSDFILSATFSVSAAEKGVKLDQIIPIKQTLNVDLSSKAKGFEFYLNDKFQFQSKLSSIELNEVIGPTDLAEVVAITNTGVRATSVAVKFDGDLISLANVNFATNSYSLTVTARRILDKSVLMIKKHGFKQVVLEGFVDSRGDRFDGIVLSKARAAAVKKYMAGKLVGKGVAISSIGLAATKAVATNTSAVGQALNRRVEIKVKS